MSAFDSGGTTRPVGVMMPAHDAAQRAIRAIAERRWKDASASLRHLPNTAIDLRYWKALLTGAVLLGEGRLTEAEGCTLQAAGYAFALYFAEPGDSPRDDIRLAARALNQAGRILRRLDRADEALTLLQTAHHIREEHGSPDELWESSLELGQTADVLRRYDDATQWYLRAIAAAEESVESPEARQAEAWTNLSKSYGLNELYTEGVEAARRARSLWHTHDAGAADASRADMRLAGALLASVASREDVGNAADVAALDEAIALFDGAAEGLRAFGPEYDADARWAMEQVQFARRLRKQFVTSGTC